MHPELLRQLAAERDSARLQHAERRRLAAQVTRAPGPVRRFLNAFGLMLVEAGAAHYDTVGSYPDEDWKLDRAEIESRVTEKTDANGIVRASVRKQYDTAGSYPDEDTDEALAAYEALEKQRAELAAKLAQPAGGG